jgi:hypothetical protein
MDERAPKAAIAATSGSLAHTLPSAPVRQTPPDTLTTAASPAGRRAASASTAPPPSDWPTAITRAPWRRPVGDRLGLTPSEMASTSSRAPVPVLARM